MDGAGAGIHRHEIGREHDGIRRSRNGCCALILSILLPGNDATRFARRFEFCVRAKLQNEFVGEQKSFGNAVARKLLDDIKFLWIDRDGEVRGQSPGRGRPDRNARFVFQFAANDREFDVNGSVVAFLIFDFGFGERGLGASAPKDRLLRLIDEAFLNENGEGAQNFALRIWDPSSDRDVPNRPERRAV